MTWEYANSANTVVTRTNDDGSMESCLVSAIADWIADGNAPEPYVEPPAPIPQSITKAQGQAQLAIEGKYQAVVAYIDAIADPTQKLLAQIAFNGTNEWFMDSPFLNQAATDLGWMTDPEYLNEFFTAASQIKL